MNSSDYLRDLLRPSNDKERGVVRNLVSSCRLRYLALNLNAIPIFGGIHNLNFPPCLPHFRTGCYVLQLRNGKPLLTAPERRYMVAPAQVEMGMRMDLEVRSLPPLSNMCACLGPSILNSAAAFLEFHDVGRRARP